MKLLVIEDEKIIGNNIKEFLEENGYIVDLEYDGTTGFAKILKNKYDLIVADLMLPNKDGINIIKDARKIGIDTPIIILTAKDSIESKAEGFQSGADDYLIKPFSLKELKLRIQAILRRTQPNTNFDNTIKIGDYLLDIDKKILSKNNIDISLTKKEYLIVELLFLNKNKVVSKKEIEEHIWGINNDIWSDVTRSHIQVIRSKLNDSNLIKTIRGVGFIIKDK